MNNIYGEDRLRNTGAALGESVSEVSRNQSCSHRDTLIEQSITLRKQTQCSEQQCSKLCRYNYAPYQ